MPFRNWICPSVLPAAFAAILAAFAQPVPAHGQQALPNRVQIVYEAPKDQRHVSLMEAIRQRGILEKVQHLLSPFRLPRPLTFKTAGCDGEINAWFEEDTVTVCYEYVAYIVETARSPKRPAWVSEQGAIAGSMIDVFLHEGAHALFDYLDVPLLGREEDAADQVAAYMLLSLGRKDTPQLVAGIVYTYLAEAGIRDFPALKRRKLRLVDGKIQADPHALPLQRMFNTLCIAYGAAPQLFEEAVKRGALPADRADGCAEEFAQVDKAFRRLLLPHVDPDVMQQVRSIDTLTIGR